MVSFSDFTAEERQLIISIPYRVGIWISNADDNERTGLDDKRERQALEAVIGRMARAHRKMGFAAFVMKQIQQNRSHWKSWILQADEAQTLNDVQNAIDLVAAKMPKSHQESYQKQYKHAIWNIAVTVAQAFGEQIDPDNELHVDRLMAWIGSFLSAPKLEKAPENMSAAEKTALKKLRAILK